MSHQSQPKAIEAVILTLLEERGVGKSICPSDAARRFDPENWRAKMPEVREAAARLTAKGELVCTQKGQPVDVRTVRGPIRLRRP